MSRLLFLLLTTFSSLQLQFGTTSGDCPDKWSRIGSACFWVSDFIVPWGYVESACQDTHPSATPASVHSLIENAELGSLLGDSAGWLGLSRPDNSSEFTWSDESELDFTYWNQNQPGNNSNNCALTNRNRITGQWAAVDCDQKHIFTCKAPLDACPEGWTFLNDTCYIYSTGTSPGEDVNYACRTIHANAMPASIHNSEVNDLLFSMITGTDHTWIGLFRAGDSDPWHWQDGSPLDFENWQISPASGDKYAVMYSVFGTWYPWTGEYVRRYFCELKTV